MIPTNRGDMTPEGGVDYLTYVNYAINRDRAPHIKPEVFAEWYPNAAALEARYQAEHAIARAKAQAFVTWALGS